MNRADTYPKDPPKKMTALCGNCGKVWAIHGAFDGHCPAGDNVAGLPVECDTFWTPAPPTKDGDER